jgi:hypothetical protein
MMTRANTYTFRMLARRPGRVRREGKVEILCV